MKKNFLVFIVILIFTSLVSYAEESEGIYEESEGIYIEDVREFNYTLFAETQIIKPYETKEIDIRIIANDGSAEYEVSIPYAECAFYSYNNDIVSIDKCGVMNAKGNEGVGEIEIYANGNYTTVKVVVSNNPDEADIELLIAQEFLKNAQIMVGDENGNFNPDKPMTRAEFAKIICKFTDNEIKYKGFGCDYTDVAPDFWGYNYVMSATQVGLLKGYGNKVFGRDDSLTEEQAVIVLCRMLGESVSNVTYNEKGIDENGFSYGFISANGENVMEITNLQKSIPATRARVAKWLYQLYNVKNNYYN